MSAGQNPDNRLQEEPAKLEANVPTDTDMTEAEAELSGEPDGSSVMTPRKLRGFFVSSFRLFLHLEGPFRTVLTPRGENSGFVSWLL
jgi:hypothetical protein